MERTAHSGARASRLIARLQFDRIFPETKIRLRRQAQADEAARAARAIGDDIERIDIGEISPFRPRIPDLRSRPVWRAAALACLEMPHDQRMCRKSQLLQKQRSHRRHKTHL